MISDIDSEDNAAEPDETVPPAPDPPLPPPPPPRRLTRSHDRKIGGVAGGIAEYFGIDPIIIRLGFVVALFAGGTGFLAYVIAWVVLPDSDGSSPPPRSNGVDTSTAVALALLALAVVFGLSDPFDGGVLTPLILIGAGVYLLHQRPLDSPTSDPAPGALPPAPLPPPPTDSGVVPATGPSDQTAVTGSGAPPGTEVRPPAAPRVREPAIITRVTTSIVALVFAGAIAVHQLDWVDVDASTVLAIALTLTGAGALAASFLGRGRGLIPIGILLGLALAAAAVIEPVVEDGVGDRSFAPMSLEDVKPSYELGVGELVVDLRDIEIPEGTTLEVDVELGIGEATVLVPTGTDLDLRGDVGIGELVVLGVDEDGIGNEMTIRREFPGEGELVIELDVGIGSGRIRRG